MPAHVALVAMLILAPLAFAGTRGIAHADACIVFEVVDETGLPVPKAVVNCEALLPPSARYKGKSSDTFSGTTDAEGRVEVRIVAYDDMKCVFTKREYYDSVVTYRFHGRVTPDVVDGRWQPWASKETVVLKRIRNPIPMYAKRVDVDVPETGKAVGYDLEKGDWVSPYGKGIVPDLAVTVTGQTDGTSEADTQMVVTFQNPGDGIASYTVPLSNDMPSGSILVSAHEAPETGYDPEYRYAMRYRPKAEDQVNVVPCNSLNFYFRVRSEMTDEGERAQAWYGKMYGDLIAHFHYGKTIRISFTYYLNPDGTRNVEYDPKRNLFRWSRDEERGQDPCGP